MASRYQGVAFYEYHKAFSSRCASLLLNYNVKIDWSKIDTSIYCSVFAGQKASTCQLCNSTLHQTNFCPANVSGAARQKFGQGKDDNYGRSKGGETSKQACLLYNRGKCTYSPCKFSHHCSLCSKSFHGAHQCYTVNPTSCSQQQCE